MALFAFDATVFIAIVLSYFYDLLQPPDGDDGPPTR